MIISVGVVAYNEQNTLPKLFECIKAQTYPHDKMEIVLVDSMSKDDTKSLMEKFKKTKIFVIYRFWIIRKKNWPEAGMLF